MPLWNSRNNNNGNPNSGDPYAPPPPKDYGDDDDNNVDDDDKLDLHSILAPYTPLLQKLSLSSFLGYCSAITAKKLGQRLAFSIGLGFMICQGLVYKGIVHVDWKQVEKSVAHVVDTVREVSSLLFVHHIMSPSHLHYDVLSTFIQTRYVSSSPTQTYIHYHHNTT